MNRGSFNYRQCGPEARAIVWQIANEHGLTFDDILGSNRAHYVAHVRHACMVALYETQKYSMESIGELFGRHHTSVLHAIRSHGARMAMGKKIKPKPTPRKPRQSDFEARLDRLWFREETSTVTEEERKADIAAWNRLGGIASGLK